MNWILLIFAFNIGVTFMWMLTIVKTLHEMNMKLDKILRIYQIAVDEYETHKLRNSSHIGGLQ